MTWHPNRTMLVMAELKYHPCVQKENLLLKALRKYDCWLVCFQRITLCLEVKWWEGARYRRCDAIPASCTMYVTYPKLKDRHTITMWRQCVYISQFKIGAGGEGKQWDCGEWVRQTVWKIPSHRTLRRAVTSDFSLENGYIVWRVE